MIFGYNTRPDLHVPHTKVYAVAADMRWENTTYDPATWLFYEGAAEASKDHIICFDIEPVPQTGYEAIAEYQAAVIGAVDALRAQTNGAARCMVFHIPNVDRYHLMRVHEGETEDKPDYWLPFHKSELAKFRRERGFYSRGTGDGRGLHDVVDILSPSFYDHEVVPLRTWLPGALEGLQRYDKEIIPHIWHRRSNDLGLVSLEDFEWVCKTLADEAIESVVCWVHSKDDMTEVQSYHDIAAKYF